MVPRRALNTVCSTGTGSWPGSVTQISRHLDVRGHNLLWHLLLICGTY